MEEEAKIVREIYRKFMKVKTTSWIANYLTKNKIKTPGGKDKWQKSTVDSILTMKSIKEMHSFKDIYWTSWKKDEENEGEIPRIMLKIAILQLLILLNGN